MTNDKKLEETIRNFIKKRKEEVLNDPVLVGAWRRVEEKHKKEFTKLLTAYAATHGFDLHPKLAEHLNRAIHHESEFDMFYDFLQWCKRKKKPFILTQEDYFKYLKEHPRFLDELVNSDA